MAQGPAVSWSANVLCRYFMHGACRKGDDCEFSHDRGTKPSMVCRYYIRGLCRFGDQCRYDHVKGKSPEILPNSPMPPPPMEMPIQHAPPPPHHMYQPQPQQVLPQQVVQVGMPPLMMPTADNTTPYMGRMVTLVKGNTEAEKEDGPTSPQAKNPEKWAMAAEFVPGQVWGGATPSTYVEAAQIGQPVSRSKTPPVLEKLPEHKPGELCPYAAQGECRYGEMCTYVHGEMCEMCGKQALHPSDKELRDKHTKECIKWHEEDMELSFAVQRSKSKDCGICMEEVINKNPVAERRFGILSNCNHCFCLECIRKWRAAKQFDNKIVRACPECRVKSDFVTPSKYWVEDKQEKEKLIIGYKQALSRKPCKYFDQGRSECPFNQHCFYQHAYPDGRPASPKPVRRNRRQNADGEFDLMHRLLLWDFLEEFERERSLMSIPLALELEDDLLDDILMLWDMSDDSDSDVSDSDEFVGDPYS